MPRTSIRSPGYCRHKAKGLAYVELSGQVYYLGPWQSGVRNVVYSRLLAICHVNSGSMPGGRDATIAKGS